MLLINMTNIDTARNTKQAKKSQIVKDIINSLFQSQKKHISPKSKKI